jgi:hypothetical protein
MATATAPHRPGAAPARRAVTTAAAALRPAAALAPLRAAAPPMLGLGVRAAVAPLPLGALAAARRLPEGALHRWGPGGRGAGAWDWGGGKGVQGPAAWWGLGPAHARRPRLAAQAAAGAAAPAGSWGAAAAALPPPPSPSATTPSRPGRRPVATSAAASEPAGGAGRRITQNEFTEKAWQAVVAAPEIATGYSQQIVETEHLLKALLEQPNGLARRIVSKAGSDPTRLLEKADAFIQRQPRQTGSAAQQVRGRARCGRRRRLGQRAARPPAPAARPHSHTRS